MEINQSALSNDIKASSASGLSSSDQNMVFLQRQKTSYIDQIKKIEEGADAAEIKAVKIEAIEKRIQKLDEQLHQVSNQQKAGEIKKEVRKINQDKANEDPLHFMMAVSKYSQLHALHQSRINQYNEEREIRSFAMDMDDPKDFLSPKQIEILVHENFVEKEKMRAITRDMSETINNINGGLSKVAAGSAIAKSSELKSNGQPVEEFINENPDEKHLRAEEIDAAVKFEPSRNSSTNATATAMVNSSSGNMDVSL